MPWLMSLPIVLHHNSIMMCFNEPYEYEGKEPMEIKHDFIDYCMGCDAHGMETILRGLAMALPSDQLGSIMDDMMMGRL